MLLQSYFQIYIADDVSHHNQEIIINYVQTSYFSQHISKRARFLSINESKLLPLLFSICKVFVYFLRMRFIHNNEITNSVHKQPRNSVFNQKDIANWHKHFRVIFGERLEFLFKAISYNNCLEFCRDI